MVFVTFRKKYVAKRGLEYLVRQFKVALDEKGVKVQEWVETGPEQVGVVVHSLSDMMEVKTIAPLRRSVLIAQMGEENILARFITQEEKDEFYAGFSKKVPKPKKKKKAAPSEDL